MSALWVVCGSHGTRHNKTIYTSRELTWTQWLSTDLLESQDLGCRSFVAAVCPHDRPLITIASSAVDVQPTLRPLHLGSHLGNALYLTTDNVCFHDSIWHGIIFIDKLTTSQSWMVEVSCLLLLPQHQLVSYFESRTHSSPDYLRTQFIQRLVLNLRAVIQSPWLIYRIIKLTRGKDQLATLSPCYHHCS